MAERESIGFGLRRAEANCAGAFTLIELILVMAMLAIVISVALPSLKGFFRGRNLDSEARRFLSLTRYGQSRAVSEGVPMVLWIADPIESVDAERAACWQPAHDPLSARWIHQRNQSRSGCVSPGRGRTDLDRGKHEPIEI